LPQLPANIDFFTKVFEVVKLIPYGRVTSYGAIAGYLGAKRSARMVGWAMNKSHHLEDKIPAHRVVNRSGLLSGKAHFGNGDEMKNLLEAEGITVTDHQIKDFETHFWDPIMELSL
jgi:methylated-DNA-protein-cysteine methyltransferase-like protein